MLQIFQDNYRPLKYTNFFWRRWRKALLYGALQTTCWQMWCDRHVPAYLKYLLRVKRQIWLVGDYFRGEKFFQLSFHKNEKILTFYSCISLCSWFPQSLQLQGLLVIHRTMNAWDCCPNWDVICIFLQHTLNQNSRVWYGCKLALSHLHI